MDGEVTNGFLRSVLMQLSAHGRFVERTTPSATPQPHPVIRRDPVIFLRNRSLGFATALEGVIEDLEVCEELPASLLRIVGIETPEDAGQIADEEKSSVFANEDETVLLSKPANPEQVRIARRLERHGCVLVQGPPGTGKTHTIANLVGHLLAQGKSVLVTSHTTKALRVLRDQVVPTLQPLCVSVLESDEEGRQQLERSVQTIVERLSESDADDLRREADALDATRRQLLRQLRQTREELRLARSNEYRDVVVAGQALNPSAAARDLAAGVGVHDWIPSPVKLGSHLPLGVGLLAELYRTNATLSEADERECTGVLPEIKSLPTPPEYEDLLTEYVEAKKLDRETKAALWAVTSPAGSEVIPEIEKLHADLMKAVTPLSSGEGDRWQLEVVAAGARGGRHRETWEALATKITALADRAAEAQEELLTHGPQLDAARGEAEQRDLLRSIIAHLEGGRTLGFLTLLRNRSWKPFISGLRVGQSTPSTLAHFKALFTLATLCVERRELGDRWTRQVTPLGGPRAEEFGDLPERTALQYVDKIRHLLDWSNATWAPVLRRLTSFGFNWQRHLADVPPKSGPFGDLLRLSEAVTQHLVPVFAARAAKIRFQTAEAKLRAIVGRLAPPSQGTAADVTQALRQAASGGKLKEYEVAYHRLSELTKLRADAGRRRNLLIELETTAPGWAAALRGRRAPHDDGVIPGDPERAWLWRQYNDELDLRAKTSQHELQMRIETLLDQMIETTAQLVDRRAWEAQVRRTTFHQRQALMGWRKIIQRIGKGTGKRVPQLRAEARTLMEQSRTAVPVWIMPLARVVENFRPGTARFDVVIIDEASQSSILELLAFYLGKQVVVVGDDKQVSPDAVGQNLSQVSALIEEHLTDIPNRQLYDGQLSVYDLAMQSFSGMIALREHFRCADDIIQFSNYLSYDGQIRPLRDVSSVATRPHVVAHRVQGVAHNKVNEVEALTIASMIAAACRIDDYAGKTFGVVSLLGDDQAERVEELLRQHLPPTEFESRRILCGNAAQFQGDERDVVFLSMVDSPAEGPLAMRADSRFTKRYNVAASRAKDQMWVVYSLNHEVDVRSSDLRRRLIEHALDPTAVTRAIESVAVRAESEFERLVLSRLVAKGYRTFPQVKVGFYRIDIVVEGGRGQLAVECDGDRYHPPEKLEEDIARQAVLERIGWKFIRIRGSEFFRDPEQAMKPVWAKLAQLGITPDAVLKTTPQAQDELQQMVIREAERMRADWRQAAESMGLSSDTLPGLSSYTVAAVSPA